MRVQKTPKLPEWVTGLPVREPRRGSEPVDAENNGVSLGHAELEKPIAWPGKYIQETGR